MTSSLKAFSFLSRRLVLSLAMVAVLAAMPMMAANQFNGWAVGEFGTILHTTDGVTWTPQVSGSTNFFFGVWFVDTMNGWVVGDSGSIYHTTDGGVTWLPQVSGTLNSLFGVVFTDLNNGWVVGDVGTVVHTSDGGTTWSPQTVGTMDALFGVSFPDPTHGWIVGAGGDIFATTNGGATWTPQMSGVGTDLNSVSFVDDLHGWTVGLVGTILQTNDGGANWFPNSSPTSFSLYGVVFVDGKNGWAVGENGEVIHTSSAGESWVEQPSGIGATLNGVSFVDLQNGWAAGGNETAFGAVHKMSRPAHPDIPIGGGFIINTNNGGVTWNTQIGGTVPILQAINFPKLAPAAPTTPSTLDGTYQVKIFPNLGAGDSVINIGNTGASGTTAAGSLSIGGNVCVNVYVFSPDEQEVACCTCLVTPNAVVTTSARQLVSKTLTPAVPTSVTVKLLATDGSGGASTCNAAAPGALEPGLIAFGTNLHLAATGGSNTTGTYAVTETPFIPSVLSAAELARITTTCGFIQTNGTGFGVCPGCTTGAAGAVRRNR